MLNSLVYVALWSLDLKVVKSSKIVFVYSKTLFYGFGFIFCYVSVFPVYFVVAAISVFVDKTMCFISSIVLRSWTSCNEGCGSWTAHRDFVRMHHNFLDVDFCSFSSDALAHKTITSVTVWISVSITDVLECSMSYMLLFLWYAVWIVTFYKFLFLRGSNLS